jgi:hypothetical protein
MKKALISLFLAVIVLVTACISTGRSGQFTIVSPYRNVDWNTFNQYKAALHTHTTNSDGGVPLNTVIETHYSQGFDILAITDHNYEFDVGRANNRWQPFTADWVNAPNGLSQARFDEISSGAGRNGRGMLQIPYTSEIACWPDEFNAFFFDGSFRGGNNNLRNTLRIADQNPMGSLTFINHPGRATGAVGNSGEGADASNDPYFINKYANLFLEFPSLVGMEIFNRQDRDSEFDRILWDNILRVTIPQGKYVWGFANDDSHSLREIGINWNVFVMNENTLDSFRDAMKNGNFYMIARVAKFERDTDDMGTGPVPVINNIVVDENRLNISITAENYDVIQWIYDNRIIHQGDAINLARNSRRIGSYIRAVIIGPGGVALTQPFGLVRN